MSINSLLLETAGNHKDKTAIIDEDNNISFSYEKLICAVDNLGAFFIKNGLQPGIKAAIFMNNSINWIVTFYSLLKIGAVPVLIDSQYTLREFKECITASGTGIVIIDDNRNKIDDAASCLEIDKAFLFSTGSASDNKKIVIINPDILTDKQDVNFSDVHLGSGDGGMILFTYRGFGYILPVFLRESSVLNSVRYNTDLTGIDDGLIIGLFLPSHHIFALTSNILCPLSVAGTIIITNNYMPANLIRIIEKYRINFILAVPTIITIRLHTITKKKYDHSFIKKGVVGGDRFGMELYDEWLSITGCSLMQGYGLTETCPVICNGLTGNKPGSIGRLLGNAAARIIDENGNEAPVNEPGILWIKSDTMFEGYYNLENLKDKLIRDGYFNTGDVVYRDNDDYYYFVRRAKEIAKIGGSTVDINEVLNVVKKHPDITDADIHIEADNLWQEKLVLNVASSPDLNKIDLMIYLKNYLSPSKIPRDIITGSSHSA